VSRLWKSAAIVLIVIAVAFVRWAEIARLVRVEVLRATTASRPRPFRAGRDVLAGPHVDRAQVAVHADETLAVIDEHGIAGEEVVPRFEHGALRRG